MKKKQRNRCLLIAMTVFAFSVLVFSGDRIRERNCFPLAITKVEAASVPVYIIKDYVLLKYNGKEETVIIPSSVTTIGEKAFAKNKYIMQVIIPETVTSMKDEVFKDCSNLEEVVLPQSLTKIGTGSFRNCENMKSIIWPKQLKEIPDYTFMLSGIKQFDFSETEVEKIGKGAFAGSRIEKVWMTDTMEELEENVFAQCVRLKEIRLSNKIKELPISFCEDTPITSIDIPDSVEKINEMAFAECEDLNNILGGSNVKEIGSGAFYETKWIEQEDQPLQIGHVYVKDSGLLEQVIIPEQVQMIYDEAFKDNVKVKEVKFPSSLKMIGEDAFYGCKRLTEVEFPEGLQKIQTNAFRACIFLEEVKFPESLQMIGDTAFAGCRSLNTYQFPMGDITFGENVFYGVEQGNAGEFNEFIVANHNTLIAYIDTANEDEVRIPEGVERIGRHVFHLEHMIGTLYIPGSIKVIEKESFLYPEIRSIVLEDGVTEIEKDGIYQCYVNTLVIPESVKKIGSLKIWEENTTPFSVVCKKGSYGYEYAKKHNITIQLQFY